MKSTKVQVILPKFETVMEFDLLNTLLRFGLTTLGQAHFNQIYNLAYVSAIIQKCKIRIDEDGTEASAVTVMPVQATRELSKVPKVFRANKSFTYYLINRQTQDIVFCGVFRGYDLVKDETYHHCTTCAPR